VAALDSAARTAAAAATVDNAVADTVAADVCSGCDHLVTITVVVIPQQVERRAEEE